MKNLFLRMMALAIISTLIITGCGAANAAPKQPADTATTTATAEQAQPADTAITAATTEQAADETDTVCITFSDTEEVLKCRLDGDTYSCSTSTHTFKMRGVEKIEGQYTFEELPAEWQMMITKVREHDKW